MNEPTFLFVGPDRVGSTSLFNMFCSHPDIFVPKLKDTFFFNRFAYKGFQKYLRYFQYAKQNQRAIGELSHDYISDDLARARIAKFLPNVTILILVRNPTDRSVSHWKFRKRSGAANRDYREDLFHCEALLNYGKYGEFIKKWQSSFPKEQICELAFRTLTAEQRRIQEIIGDKLNVDSSAFLKTQKYTTNKAYRPRSYFILKISRQLGNVLRSLGLGGLWGSAKSSNLIKRYLFLEFPENHSSLCNFRLAVCKIFQTDLTEFEEKSDLYWVGLRT